MSHVLFVVAPDFRDEELFDTRTELAAEQCTFAIASTGVGHCRGMRGGGVDATLAIEGLDTRPYDAVVFVGGSGARTLFDDPDAHRIAQELHADGRIIGAICVAPTILARAGLLRGHRVTAFPSELETLAAAGAQLEHAHVVVDGNVITASGPAHARQFGRAIARALRAIEHPSARAAGGTS